MSLPSGGFSREEIAKIEIGHTNVTPSVARTIAAAFLLLIASVPAIELIGSPRVGNGNESAWSMLLSVPDRVREAVRTNASLPDHSLWTNAVAGNRATIAALVAFESAIEDESLLGRRLRPPAQYALSGWLGAGNEQVYVGRTYQQEPRWLFYRQDVEYVTGGGFLDRAVMERRKAVASEVSVAPQPDPRPAVLGFYRHLEARGITLVLVPTPVKPGVYPERLSASVPRAPGVLQNVSYGAFLQWANEHGIVVFDPGSTLLSDRDAAPRYLATDTHWSPEGMSVVVQQLAAFVKENVFLPDIDPPTFMVESRAAENWGDTALMLDLPEDQQLYPRERVTIDRIVDPTGESWQSDHSADVLVLGDSFANIYSLESMGWGTSGGFVEHLSYAMRRPIDRIVQNDGGAFATRQLLAQTGAERLIGKRVVIWQFAVREFAFGDWKVVE